jgi:hypothetical protein
MHRIKLCLRGVVPPPPHKTLLYSILLDLSAYLRVSSAHLRVAASDTAEAAGELGGGEVEEGGTAVRTGVGILTGF